MGSLSNLYISQSYISLIHLGSNATITTSSVELQDGLGNGIGVFVNSLGDLNINGTFQADLPKGYVWVGDGSNRSSLVATSSLSTNTNIDTGSLLTTASFNVYTASQEALNNTFATTGSNTFTGGNTFQTNINAQNGLSILGQTTFGDGQILNTFSLENISGSLVFNKIATASKVDLQNLSLLVSGTFTASLQEGYVWVGNNAGKTVTVATSSFGGGGALPSGLLSSSVTNFVDYSASVDSRINGIVVGSGFATTGSNTFTGNQTISTAGNTQLSLIATPGFQTNIQFQSENSNFNAYGDFNIINNGQFGGSGSIKMLTKSNFIEFAADQGFRMGVTNGIGNGIDNSGFVTINVPSGSQQFQLTGSLVVSNTLTASLAEGYVWAGGAGNISTLVATSSFGGTIPAGVYATLGANTFTGSQNILDANLVISNSGSAFLTMNAGTQNNVLFNSPGTTLTSYGSLNFTNNGTAGGSGSLQFTAVSASISYYSRDGFIFGRATAESGPLGNGFVKMNTSSGSLVLSPSGFNNNATDLLHLSASSNSNFVNLVFKNNNTTGDTIISGSNNIFTNPGAPTAGFKRYIGGNNNLYGSVHVPQITGSAGFSPAMNNNIIATGMLMRLPVSSSAYTMNGNILNNPAANGIQFGVSAASNFERAVSGLTFNNNVINGNITALAFKTPLSASIGITNNNIGGGVTLNMDSSSIGFSGNLVQGGLIVNNSYFPATTGSQVLSNINGSLYVGNNTIYLSGSNTTFTGAPGRTISNISMLGNSNVISASYNGDLAQLNSTILLGQSLNVLGTNSRAAGATAADWGSVFVGRWNDFSANKGGTGETIFAVGTGTGTTTRKTGLLIDSGSNTFVEGTLNVSGSTSLTGSLTIQSGSSFFANGTKQFNVGAFYSTVTQSGSAGVSQSMNFNTTDISEGVTLNGGGTQFILANAGVYNIQFSAQVLSTTGADDIWIWLKKNGTNVSNSAGRITLANNEEIMAAWNYVVTANAGDYFELAWENSATNGVLLYNAPGINYPAVPSVIATVTQVR